MNALNRARHLLVDVGYNQAVRRGFAVGADMQPRTPDFNSFLTESSLAREPSPIRALMPMLDTPGMISLGGGLPHPDTFPFGRISVRLSDGTKMRISEDDVRGALQYSATQGLPKLVAHLKAIQTAEHQPQQQWDLCVTSGSQDGLTRAFEMLLPAGATHSLLLESPTYSGALAFLGPHGCRRVGVATDKYGLVPDDLERVLETWDDMNGSQPRPRVLYTIPTGSNPTGGSLSLERKQRIYEIARHPANNLIILEDDPYYYLQFGNSNEENAKIKRVPSFFSLDIDGRVIRFDSFSKLLSAGCRIGFVSAAPEIIDRLTLHIQSTALHTSGVSQLLVAALLDRWEDHHNDGHATIEPTRGFERHVQLVSRFYRERRDLFVQSAEKHLTGLAEWTVPTAGMFSWIKLNNINDSMDLIQSKAVDAKVLFVPGGVFMPNGEPSPYVRASFSTASPEQIDEALARLRKLLLYESGTA